MLLAFVLQLLAFLNLVSRSHDPIHQLDMHVSWHGAHDHDDDAVDHVHPDGDLSENVAHHVHGHDSTDHRHDTPAPVSLVFLTTHSLLPDTWIANEPQTLFSSDINVLEKPPKQLS